MLTTAKKQDLSSLRGGGQDLNPQGSRGVAHKINTLRHEIVLKKLPALNGLRTLWELIGNGLKRNFKGLEIGQRIVDQLGSSEFVSIPYHFLERFWSIHPEALRFLWLI